ncbi:MAG: glycosyltransferase [Alkalilacustris sp.]
MKIAIVMVNYRTPELVLDCLRSLAEERSDGVALEVMIGDAASGDRSVERIAQGIAAEGWDWARCFAIGRNGGFAYGNNFVLRHHALTDPQVTHVHFLNPDTYIRPGAVRALATFLSGNAAAGAAGSLLENPDGTPRACAFRFPAPWRELFRGLAFSVVDRWVPSSRGVVASPGVPMRVDWVSGASFMVPRDVLERVGLMDDGYFLYFEETDLMARMAAAGLEVWHVPTSRVVHLAGQATGVRSGGRPGRLSPHWLRSRARFTARHHGRLGLIWGTALYLLGDLGYRLRCAVLLRRPKRPPGLWRDYLRFGLRHPAAADGAHDG